MRFYVTASDAEPVGPKSGHTYRGRQRRSYTVEEASRECGWPKLALIALHDATYPAQAEDDVRWLDQWAEAMFQPAVRERLAFHVRSLGTVPPETFLIALLDEWDDSDSEWKTRLLVKAFGVDFLPKQGAFRNRDGGKGADHG